jgi:hypothetical protein
MSIGTNENPAIGSFDKEDAIGALLNKWGVSEDEDQREAASEPEDDTDDPEDEGSDEDTTEGETGDDAAPDGDEPPKSEPAKTEAPDDAVVRYKVGDEEYEVPVKDLKRLAGQERALTQRSQQLAEQRKTFDQQAQIQAVALDRLYKSATERMKPYEDVDWVLAAAQMEPETYAQLRADAQEAYKDVQFLKSEIGSFMDKVESDRKANLQAQARESLKVLTDPVDGIPGFSKELYGEIRAHAISVGLPTGVVDSLVDPAALKLIYESMMFRKGTTAATKVIRKPKTPEKVVSKVKADTGPKAKGSAGAMSRLRSERTSEAAIDALVARWAESDD